MRKLRFPYPGTRSMIGSSKGSVESRHPEFIREMCGVLANRWEPERLFVILKSYFDESGTHGGSPITVMSGIMGTAQQWSKFERATARLKRRYGFTIFHAKDFKSRSGQFAGWPGEKCDALLLDLAKAANGLMEVVTTVLPNDDYASFYRLGDTPRRVRLDTKYGLCFRYSLVLLVYHAVARLGHHKNFDKTRLHVIMEGGHKNAGDAQRIFEETKREVEALDSKLLASITFVTKEEADPLLVADFVAHSTFGQQRGGAIDIPRPADLKTQSKTGLTQLRLTPEVLSQTQDDLVGVFNERLRKRAPTPPAASLEEAALKVFERRYG